MRRQWIIRGNVFHQSRHGTDCRCRSPDQGAAGRTPAFRRQAERARSAKRPAGAAGIGRLPGPGAGPAGRGGGNRRGPGAVRTAAHALAARGRVSRPAARCAGPAGQLSGCAVRLPHFAAGRRARSGHVRAAGPLHHQGAAPCHRVADQARAGVGSRYPQGPVRSRPGTRRRRRPGLGVGRHGWRLRRASEGPGQRGAGHPPGHGHHFPRHRAARLRHPS